MPTRKSTAVRTPACLVVDIGNTRTKLAAWRNGRLGREVSIPTPGLSVRAAREAAEQTGAGTGAAVLASVVPAAQATWERALHGRRLHWVDHHSPLGIPVTYPHPATIGPDRLVNAAAAASRYGTPVVVADIGTALTVDVVLPNQGFVGGIIAPGPAAMTEYLAARTARLPPVSLRPTSSAIGRSTQQAIRAGTWFGYRGLLREILTNILHEAGGPNTPLCATGGHAKPFLPDLFPDATLEPRLTQRGLAEIAQRLLAP
jgi:type III pantothenate kinase